MKSFYVPLLSFLAIAYFSSCKKQDIKIIDFTHYTTTDSACAILGETDDTDWAADTSWSAQEAALLNFSDAIILVDSVTGFIQLSPPCPNPSHGQFILGINTE